MWLCGNRKLEMACLYNVHSIIFNMMEKAKNIYRILHHERSVHYRKLSERILWYFLRCKYVMKKLKVLWNWKTDSFNWPPCGCCYCWGNFFVDMLKVTQFALHHTQTRRIKKEPTVSPLQLSWHGIIRWKEVFSLKKCIDTLLFKLYCTAQFQLLASIERIFYS